MFEFLRVFFGIIIAFALCMVVIALMLPSGSIMDGLKNFMIGPLTSERRFAQLLGRYAPTMLTGCGMCFIYAAGRFNLIGEGIMNFGPIPIMFIIFRTTLLNGLPQPVNMAILVIACAITGALVALIPATAREELGANEMVMSSITNLLLLYVSLACIKLWLSDRSQSYLGSPKFPENMRWARYWGNTNFTEGFWIAVVGVIIAIVIFYRTKVGTKIRLCGANLSFAQYSGINAKRTIYMGQLIGGAFAGVASAVHNFGLFDYYFLERLTEYGMDGLIIAVMARKHPIFVPFTAFVLGYIRVSAQVLNANTRIPIELVTMLQAVIVLFVAAEGFLKKAKLRMIFKAAREQEAATKLQEVAG